MPRPEPNRFGTRCFCLAVLAGAVISAIDQTIALEDALAGTHPRIIRWTPCAAGASSSPRRTNSSTALVLIELDGVAASVVLCPPDLKPEHYPTIIENAGADTIVVDAGARRAAGSGGSNASFAAVGRCTPAVAPQRPAIATEWLLLTSGTTGAPKIVQHNFAGLTAAIRPRAAPARPLVWATFYDIRRYGGLQILLRSLLGTGSMVLSSSGEAIADHLHRLGRGGVTHISGTPSHWRRALMSPAITAIAPDYVRLSGEIADQTILDALRHAFPTADIGHAYASTEAGVGFEVDDGREGFPASFVGQGGAVRMKVEDGSLRIKSARAASRYVGSADLCRSSTPRASSKPETWSSCGMTAIISWGGGAASSMSAA